MEENEKSSNAKIIVLSVLFVIALVCAIIGCLIAREEFNHNKELARFKSFDLTMIYNDTDREEEEYIIEGYTTLQPIYCYFSLEDDSGELVPAKEIFKSMPIDYFYSDAERIDIYDYVIEQFENLDGKNSKIEDVYYDIDENTRAVFTDFNVWMNVKTEGVYSYSIRGYLLKK